MIGDDLTVPATTTSQVHGLAPAWQVSLKPRGEAVAEQLFAAVVISGKFVKIRHVSFSFTVYAAEKKTCPKNFSYNPVYGSRKRKAKAWPRRSAIAAQLQGEDDG